ncbi:hypothetical protein EON67_00305 [archaeon]|nr:MAG: hypothetical protein EON67_00305 [archaeon]
MQMSLLRLMAKVVSNTDPDVARTSLRFWYKLSLSFGQLRQYVLPGMRGTAPRSVTLRSCRTHLPLALRVARCHCACSHEPALAPCRNQPQQFEAMRAQLEPYLCQIVTTLMDRLRMPLDFATLPSDKRDEFSHDFRYRVAESISDLSWIPTQEAMARTVFQKLAAEADVAAAARGAAHGWEGLEASVYALRNLRDVVDRSTAPDGSNALLSAVLAMLPNMVANVHLLYVRTPPRPSPATAAGVHAQCRLMLCVCSCGVRLQGHVLPRARLLCGLDCHAGAPHWLRL